MARAFLRRLRRDQRGAIAIETAVVAPVLALMSVGAFQVSAMVARQSELQSAAAEAEAIALASPPDTVAERNTLKQIIMASARLDADQVTLVEKFRCNSAANLVDSSGTCATGDEISTFVQITITDTYTPQWTHFGVGEPLDYNLVRTVQVS